MIPIENFYTNLSEKYSSFTHSQKSISDYLSEHLESVAFFTLEELSQKAGTSTTTVIRFARTLGYDGFSDMQKAIQNEIRNKAALPERVHEGKNIPADELLRSSFANDIENIRNTLAAQKDDDLKECIRFISNAGKIFILGMRSSFSVAYYTTSRLAEIRSNVHLIQSTGMLYPEEIVNAAEGDVCIAFLFPRYSKNTASILSWFRNHGIKVILITGMNISAVKEYGDIFLPCAVSSVSYKNSFAAPMCLINYLTAALVQDDPEKARQILARTESILTHGYYLGI